MAPPHVLLTIIRQSRSRFWRLIIPLLLSSAACGGTSSTAPASPTPTPATAMRPAVSLLTLGIKEHTASVQWTPYVGATQYEVRVGTSVGGAEISALTMAATTATLANLPPSQTIYVTVNPTVSTGASLSGNLEFYLVDFRKVIEALFFQTGPYSTGSVAGQVSLDPPFAQMRGFVPGTQIRVLLSGDLERVRGAAERTAAQVADATAGVLSAFVEPGGDNTIIQLPNTVKVVSTAQVCAGGIACAIGAALPAWKSSIVLWGEGQGRPELQVMAHELGHALLGLGHFGGYRDLPFAYLAGSFKSTLMFPLFTMDGSPNNFTSLSPQGLDSLSALEMDAVRMVYSAGLRPGATRSDFAARGLVLP